MVAFWGAEVDAFGGGAGEVVVPGGTWRFVVAVGSSLGCEEDIGGLEVERGLVPFLGG